MVTITKCATEAELDGVSAALRLAGIEHTVRRAKIGTPGWELSVQEADSERADDIVNRIYGIETHDTDVAPPTPVATLTVCDECGSDDIARVPKLQIFLLAFVMSLGFVFVADPRTSRIGFFLFVGLSIVLLVIDKWRCRECGYSWK